MPLAGHTPMHPRWSEHHRPTSTALQTACCEITRPGVGGGALDEGNVWTPAAESAVYSGPCRVGSDPTAAAQQAGDAPVGIVQYTVAIEWDAAEVLEGDTVTITQAADPGLAGKQLRVTNPRHSAESWERVLACTDDITRREV